MRIRSEQLLSYLSSRNYTVYILTGSDECMREWARQKIGESLKAQAILLTHCQEKIPDLTAAAQNISLFSEKKCIQWFYEEKSAGKSFGEALQCYAQNNTESPDIIWLFSGTRIDKAFPDKSLQAWMNAHPKILIVTCYTPSAYQLPAFIAANIPSSLPALSKTVLTKLISLSEGNMAAIFQFIQHYILLQSSNPVSDEFLLELLSSDPIFDVFLWAEALLKNNKTQAQKMLYTLRHADTPLLLIVWSLFKLIENMNTLYQGLIVDKKNKMELMKKMMLTESRFTLYEQALKKISMNTLGEWLEKAYLIDKAIKQAELRTHPLHTFIDNEWIWSTLELI